MVCSSYLFTKLGNRMWSPFYVYFLFLKLRFEVFEVFQVDWLFDQVVNQKIFLFLCTWKVFTTLLIELKSISITVVMLFQQVTDKQIFWGILKMFITILFYKLIKLGIIVRHNWNANGK